MILKLNNEDGFTLAETLMTVLIMLLVSSVIAAGIPAAAKAYRKAVDAANAQVLLSTRHRQPGPGLQGLSPAPHIGARSRGP